MFRPRRAAPTSCAPAGSPSIVAALLPAAAVAADALDAAKGTWLSEDGRFGDNWQCTDLGAAVSGRRRPSSPAEWVQEPDFVYDVGPGMGDVHRWGDPR